MNRPYSFSWFFAFGLFILFACSPVALAEGEVARVKIISAVQTLESGALSGVFTVETQGADGLIASAATTTRVSLTSSSASCKFYSSPAAGPCGSEISPASITVSKNTSHKSFCYSDSSLGAYSISISVPDQPGILGDAQEITIASVSTDTSGDQGSSSTSTPENQQSAAAPEYLTKSSNVKIYRFLPNPTGDDAGKEWVEIKNSDSKTVLLDGWLLDDKDAGSGPASDSFVLSGSLAPGEIKRFDLPGGVFALNNSGGDEVNLYFSDKILAQKAVYSATAYDDGIFEFRDGQWQPPTINPPSISSSGGGSGLSTSITSYPSVAFKLNEIFPNPLGEDLEKEWVEIYNPTSATATLEGYYLADGDSDVWSESAWAIPKNTLVPPLGFLAIILPKDSLTLNNLGKEKVKLFSPQKVLLDSVSYEDAEENQSWAKDKDGKWQWGIPTFSAPNGQLPEALKIIISEILPRPDEDGEEFVELLNVATTTVNLEGAVLEVGSRKKIFEKGAAIKSNSFLVIYEDDLPARLSNSGQTIKLSDAFGREVVSVKYGEAEAGEAYASLDGEIYVWTGSPTPGKENQMVLGAEVSALSESEESGPTAIKAKAASGITSTQAKQILAANKELQSQLALMQGSIAGLESKLNAQPAVLGVATGSPNIQTAENQESTGGLPTWVILIPGLLILAGIIFVVFKYVKL